MHDIDRRNDPTPTTSSVATGCNATTNTIENGVPRGRFLSPKAAAAYACVSVTLVYQWCEEETLPHHRVGAKGRRGKILIAVDDLAAMLASKKVGGPPRPATPPPTPRPIKPRFRHLKL